MALPDIIKQTARDLRKKQTQAEKMLWENLRRKIWKLKVYRQKPIFVMKEDNDFERYIISDFYFPYWKVIVEIDGDIHNSKDIYELDREKEKLLLNLWYKILRFTNAEVLYNTGIVIKKIEASFSS